MDEDNAKYNLLAVVFFNILYALFCSARWRLHLIVQFTCSCCLLYICYTI